MVCLLALRFGQEADAWFLFLLGLGLFSFLQTESQVSCALSREDLLAGASLLALVGPLLLPFPAESHRICFSPGEVGCGQLLPVPHPADTSQILTSPRCHYSSSFWRS